MEKEGEGAREGEDVGRPCSAALCCMSHSLKKTDISNRARHSLTKTPRVAVYPEFFVKPINVYPTRGESQSSCVLWSSTANKKNTCSTWECAAVTLNTGLGPWQDTSVRPNDPRAPTELRGPVGGTTVIHRNEDAAIRTQGFTCWEARAMWRPRHMSTWMLASIHKHGHNL